MSGQTLSEIQQLDNAVLYATCVAVDGQGALIVGRSGAGKSALALRMMALGAKLVADDRVSLRVANGKVIANAVPNILGLIEARGVGILRANPAGETPVSYVVDLDQNESKRLPEPNVTQVLGQTVPLLRAAGIPNLAEVLIQLLKMGRVDPEWPST